MLHMSEELPPVSEEIQVGDQVEWVDLQTDLDVVRYGKVIDVEVVVKYKVLPDGDDQTVWVDECQVSSRREVKNP